MTRGIENRQQDVQQDVQRGLEGLNVSPEFIPRLVYDLTETKSLLKPKHQGARAAILSRLNWGVSYDHHPISKWICFILTVPKELSFLVGVGGRQTSIIVSGDTLSVWQEKGGEYFAKIAEVYPESLTG